MKWVWDDEKARRNLAKHKVSFERATLVFDDPHNISLRDDRETEERWLTIGLVNGVVALVVVHTVEDHDNEEVVRIISARKATRSEREKHEHSYEKARSGT